MRQFHPNQTANQTEAGSSSLESGNRPWTTSFTQISSSKSSQRKAKPCTRSATFSNNACGAPVSKGNFAAGKLNSRWSANSSQTRRPSTQQRRAGTGDGSLLSMEPNISVYQGLAMLVHKSLDVGHLDGSKAVVTGQRHRLQPEFGFQLATSDVNVRRLVGFPAVEMKPIRSNAHHRWHGRRL